MERNHPPRQSRWSPKLSIDAKSKKSPELKSLRAYAESIETLEAKLQEALPPQLRQLFKVNTLRQGTLTITCAKATHKALFMANESDILASLNRLLRTAQRVTTTKIKVRPIIRQRIEKVEPRSLSEESSKLLNDEANNTEDEKLKEVLLKIASRSQA